MTFGQSGVASLPVCASMSTKVMPSGTANGTLARPASALFMNCVQIGSAACAPLRPTGWLSSKPTQTTVSSSGVKPTNQASRRSLVVPVLPAASSVKPVARALAAVPSFSTLRIMLVTRNVVSGSRDLARDAPCSSCVTSLPPLVIRAMCCSETHHRRRSETACRRWRSRTASPRRRRARSTDRPSAALPTPSFFQNAATRS